MAPLYSVAPDPAQPSHAQWEVHSDEFTLVQPFIGYSYDSNERRDEGQRDNAEHANYHPHDRYNEQPHYELEACRDYSMSRDDPLNHIWTGSNKSKGADIFPRPDPNPPPQTSHYTMYATDPASECQSLFNLPSLSAAEGFDSNNEIDQENTENDPKEATPASKTALQPYLHYSPPLDTHELPDLEVEEVVLICPMCGSEFRGAYRRGNLHRHMRSRHSTPEEYGVLECPERTCKRQFKRAVELTRHLRHRHPECRHH